MTATLTAAQQPVAVDTGDGGFPALLTQPVPAKTGRPTIYTPEMGAKIVALIRAGLTPAQIADNEAYPWAPARNAIYEWITTIREFGDAVARAREAGASAMADETVKIADDANPDERGRVEKARLRVASRQWLASKYDKRFAERQIVQHEDGQAADLTQLSAAGLADLLTAVSAHVKRQAAIDTTAEPVPSNALAATEQVQQPTSPGGLPRLK